MRRVGIVERGGAGWAICEARVESRGWPGHLRQGRIWIVVRFKTSVTKTFCLAKELTAWHCCAKLLKRASNAIHDVRHQACIEKGKNATIRRLKGLMSRIRLDEKRA